MNYFSCIVLINDKKEAVLAGRHRVSFDLCRMREPDDGILIGAGPPWRVVTCTKGLFVIAIGNQAAPNRTAFDGRPGIVDGDGGNTDRLLNRRGRARGPRGCDI